jgi:hypothetical protein
VTRYRTIVADPPWEITKTMGAGGRRARATEWSPAPRVELFARRARFGWDYWGNESLGAAEMAA